MAEKEGEVVFSGKYDCDLCGSSCDVLAKACNNCGRENRGVLYRYLAKDTTPQSALGVVLFLLSLPSFVVGLAAWAGGYFGFAVGAAHAVGYLLVAIYHFFAAIVVAIYYYATMEWLDILNDDVMRFITKFVTDEPYLKLVSAALLPIVGSVVLWGVLFAIVFLVVFVLEKLIDSVIYRGDEACISWSEVFSALIPYFNHEFRQRVEYDHERLRAASVAMELGVVCRDSKYPYAKLSDNVKVEIYSRLSHKVEGRVNDLLRTVGKIYRLQDFSNGVRGSDAEEHILDRLESSDVIGYFTVKHLRQNKDCRFMRDLFARQVSAESIMSLPWPMDIPEKFYVSRSGGVKVLSYFLAVVSWCVLWVWWFG